MSNDLSQVYQFLTRTQNWQDLADKNVDGIITRREFSDFMNANFEWNGETTEAAKNDLINNFFNKIDTKKGGKIEGTKTNNTNALDQKELASLEAKLEMYEVLEDFSSTISCPSTVTSAAEWKKDVKEDLSAIVEKFVSSNKTTDELRAELETQAPAIMNKVTVEYCVSEYLDTFQKTFKQYDYKCADDKDLQKLIKNYIATITGDTDAETIKSEITALVNDYLATAGLSAGNSSASKEAESLNELQKSVARKTLESNLAEIKNEPNYEAYAEDFDKAIAEYINNVISEAKGNDFEQICKLGINDFKATEGYTRIKTTVDTKTALNCNEGSALYEAVKTKFGANIADILTDGVYLKSYQAIIDEAVDNVLAGKLNSNDLVNFCLEKISENLTAILKESGCSSELSNDELIKMYDAQAEEAERIKYSDPDKSLKLYKEAAVAFCDALAAKGSEHKAMLEEVFGGSYASVINSCAIPKKIETLIEEVKSKLGGIIEKVEVKDKSEDIIKDMNNSLTYNGTNVSSARSKLAFRVDKNGYILFVGNNYNESAGIWDDAPDNALNDLINNQLKNKIQDQYKEEIASLGLTESEKFNLFNIALLTTLSDTTVMRSMYEEVNIGTVLEKVVENYSKMLAKVSNDTNARNYIKNAENNSILNGMGTWAGNGISGSGNETTADYNKWFKTLDKYYINDSTKGGDDWVSIASRGEGSYSYTVNGQTYSGNIILLTSADAGDNGPVNNAMKSILNDYMNTYSSYVDPAKIITLFKQAQQTAYANLEATINQSSAAGSSIYGYGETPGGSTHNADTYMANGNYYGVNSILINVIYEMEKLLSREVMGL